MARILLGWELGANRGHLSMLGEIAQALAGAGHEIHAALQTTAGARAFFPPGTQIWQAPIWPRLLTNVASPSGPAPSTMGDIICRLGLSGIEGLLYGWDSILHAVRPDAIVADFAPALLLAARGRVPTVAVGTGFQCVPGGLDRFPSLTGGPAAYDEDVALSAVSDALVQLDRNPIEHFPDLFAADRTLVATFSELDVYADARTGGYVSPAIGGTVPSVADGGGDEVFVYAFAPTASDALWDGLAQAGLPVRVHVPDASDGLRAKLGTFGFVFEERPIGWDQIAARSRIVISHGGHGFVSAALLAGIAQVVLHGDLEKLSYARAVVAMGVGGEVASSAIRAEPFAASLCSLYADEALAARARAAAPGFRARMDRPVAAEARRAIEALLRQPWASVAG